MRARRLHAPTSLGLPRCGATGSVYYADDSSRVSCIRCLRSERTRHAYELGLPKCGWGGPARYATGSDINCPDCRSAIGMAS